MAHRLLQPDLLAIRCYAGREAKAVVNDPVVPSLVLLHSLNSFRQTLGLTRTCFRLSGRGSGHDGGNEDLQESGGPRMRLHAARNTNRYGRRTSFVSKRQ
jgi:hypothetical protein